MKHKETYSGNYREPGLERAVVTILSDAGERARFLRTRDEYVASLALSSNAKDTLLALSGEQINQTATELEQSMTSPPGEMAQFTAPDIGETGPCERFTFVGGRVRCDG